MNEISEFRQNAEQCRVRASQTGSEYLRGELLTLAQHWAKLAAEHERCQKIVAYETSRPLH